MRQAWEAFEPRRREIAGDAAGRMELHADGQRSFYGFHELTRKGLCGIVINNGSFK